MQAVIGDDAFDAADADGELGLAKLLRYDLGRGVGIEKAMAQDLADGLIGAAIVGFWAGLFRFKGGQTAPQKGVANLVIALTAATIFLCDLGDVGCKAFAFHQHKEAAGKLVGGVDGEGASGTLDLT